MLSLNHVIKEQWFKYIIFSLSIKIGYYCNGIVVVNTEDSLAEGIVIVLDSATSLFA